MEARTRMLIATDGSEHALEAVRLAARTLRPEAIERVLVVAVIQPNATAPFGDPAVYAALPPSVADAFTARAETLAHAAVAAVVRELGALAGRIETLVQVGSPAQEIVRLAVEEAIDLVVMGSRGWGELRAVLLGSVSERVLHSVSCAVLIVLPGASQRA